MIKNLLKKHDLNLANLLMCAYLVIAPIDYVLVLPFKELAIINAIILMLLVLNFIKLIKWIVRTIKNRTSIKIAVLSVRDRLYPDSASKSVIAFATLFYLYYCVSNIIEIFYFRTYSPDFKFILYGALFLFLFTYQYSEVDFKLFKGAIEISCYVLAMTCIIKLIFDSQTFDSFEMARSVDPNYFACGFIICTAYMSRMICKGKNLILNLVSLNIVMFYIIRSGSRGGFLANVAVIGLSFLPYLLKSPRVFWSVATSAIILALVVSFSYPATADRFDISNLGTGSGRTIIWGNYLYSLTAAPLENIFFGVGRDFETYIYLAKEWSGILPHNMYLKLFIGGGLLGFPLFIVLLTLLVYYSAKNTNPFAWIVIVGLIFAGMTLDMDTTRDFYLFLAVGMIYGVQLNNRKKQFESPLKLPEENKTLLKKILDLI
ncbi:MAG: O-antigen ligase family protein [Christensenellaceae bacterium]|jgi:hypothetical protein|nr:O-antigen ligase family protein [Christensenellaceae bacterium]